MKAHRRSSRIWQIGIEELKQHVQDSKTIREVLTKLNISLGGGTHRILKQRLEVEGIDYSHIPLGRDHRKGRTFPVPRSAIPLGEILVEHSTYYTGALKHRLIKEGVLSCKCMGCGLTNTWNNKPLVLELDHVDGVSDNHQLENLRLLCPNCHSQTSTFRGHNRK